MSEANKEFLSRTYSIRGGPKVSLVIYQPVPFPDGVDMRCEYEISGLATLRPRQFAGGVDAIQSLLLALKMAATDLVTSAEYQLGDLFWLEEGNPDLGLPLPKSLGG